MNETEISETEQLLDEDTDYTSNCWTKIAAFGQVTSMLSNSYLYGSLIDLAFNFPDNFYGLSYWGWGFGAAIGVSSTICTTICEYSINSVNQTNINVDGLKGIDINDFYAEPKEKVSNLILRKVILAGDMVDNIGYRSGALVFAVELATQGKLDRIAKIGVQVGASIFGLFASVADYQTSKNNLELKTKVDLAQERKLVLNYGA
jgi:hypothetical protein